MSYWKSPQSSEAQKLYGAGMRYTDSIFPPPTITNPFFQPEQEVRTTDQLGYAQQPEVNTDHLEHIAPFAPENGLSEPRVTKDLRGPGATRVLQNPGSSTRLLSGTAMGTLSSTSAVRATVVIPGKKKKVRQQELIPIRHMHPRLRYGLIMGAMLGIIGLALVTLTPLKSDQTQLPVFSGVVRWIQTQQIAWNVNSHMSDQGQTTTSDQTNIGTGNTAPPITYLPMSQYVAIARQAAVNAGISPVYFVNQINAESSFNPDAISPVGAVGIAQFLPSTAAGLGINPYDPVQALNGAALHMATLTKDYGGNYAKALAAYNAGQGTVDYAVQQGGANWMNFLPYETQQYIYKIMGI
jgi:Transglycosylase SLT domain